MSAVYQRLCPLALACLAGVTASCAPLVSYDGFRGGSDDGGDASDADASSDANDAARVDGGPNGCVGAVPGVYCGRVLPAYTGGVQDLVRCLGDGTMGAVTACDAGCASMPAGRQDACNACARRADGPSCLQELIVDYPANDVVVTCGAGVTTNSAICPNGCTASACR